MESIRLSYSWNWVSHDVSAGVCLATCSQSQNNVVSPPELCTCLSSSHVGHVVYHFEESPCGWLSGELLGIQKRLLHMVDDWQEHGTSGRDWHERRQSWQKSRRWAREKQRERERVFPNSRWLPENRELNHIPASQISRFQLYCHNVDFEGD